LKNYAAGIVFDKYSGRLLMVLSIKKVLN